MAKKVTAYVKLQVAAAKANPSPPVGPALGQHGVNIGSTRGEHHGILQDLQRTDPTSGTRFADSSSDHGLQRPQFHVYHENAAGLGAAAEGAGYR